MPLRRKGFSLSSKHHPYLCSNGIQESTFLKGVSKGSHMSQSLCNISNTSNQEQFIPRSMSAIEENSDGWKSSFCGVLPTSKVLSDIGSEKHSQSFTSEKDITYHSSSLSLPAVLPRSNSQISNASESRVSQASTSPIPVPMRNDSRKRKSNFRSSGGYFFDKYMKRFKAKYGSQSQTRSLGHSETVDELKKNKYEEIYDGSNEAKLNIRSNRQDMVFTEDMLKRSLSVSTTNSYADISDILDSDDLYSVQCGNSAQWDSQHQTMLCNSLVSENDDCDKTMKVEYPPLCSVFPSSPPRFWGDANCGASDETYIFSTSPVPSLSDGNEPACRYSDSNSETLKAMETLYLCNFSVTVEGDWLCLKEICEDSVPSSVLIASTVIGEETVDKVEESLKNGDIKTVQEMKVERRNLLGMAKLSIKGLIESSLSAGHTLDSDHEPLQQFFVILEYILRHGLKAPKSFFTQNKYFWPPLETVEKLCPDACEITNSVRSLPGIRTHLGRGRAWLRLALMQKKLADYFKVFIENKQILSEWYDEGAIVMNDEAVVLGGHLVGLNCIDANLCMKGDDLDNQVTVIDYSIYMKDGNHGLNNDENEEEETTMQKLLNQKNYLEERNRFLETTSSEFQKKAEYLESANENLETELEATKIQLESLKNDKERMINERIDITASHQKTLEAREKDLDTERETLRQSRAGLDEMYTQIQKQLKHETNLRIDVEKELQLQVSLKQELEMAMKLLEKDIYDKQDGLITLREQLDNVKAINIDVYNKLQAKTAIEEKKNNTIEKLQSQTENLAQQVASLQNQLEEAKRQANVAREQADRYNHHLDDSEKKRSALVTNLQIEREWREALQAEAEKKQQEMTLLNEKLEFMTSLKDELQKVKSDRDVLQETCHEQEMTINDLAGHLGKSKQDLGDLKEVHQSMTGNTWEKDKEVTHCFQCEKQFSLSRRKHHCRHCGQIFCNSCSDNTMPLASSAKPVRVCDACHTTLLQRFSAKPV